MTIYLLGAGPITRFIRDNILAEGQEVLIVTSTQIDITQVSYFLNYLDFSAIQLTDNDKIIIGWRSMGGGLLGNERNALISRLTTNLRHASKIIYLSSGSVYGNSAEFFEEKMMVNPKTSYAIKKLEVETWLQEINSEKTIICRISNVFGAKDLPDLITQISADLKNKRPISLFEPDRFTRDYISVDAILSALQFLLTDYGSQTPALEIFNLSSYDPVSTTTILKYFKDFLGYEIPYKTLPIPNSIPTSNCLNNEKILQITQMNFLDSGLSLQDYIQTQVATSV